jgi:6-phosphofructokinase 2
VHLLKPNLAELSKLIGVERIEASEVVPSARKVIDKGGCEIIVVSMGADGAVLVTKDFEERVPTPNVEKKSTVGAGDSMVAGMVWMLCQNKSLSEVLRFGVACGTAATMNAGTALFDKEDVDHLYQRLR